MKFGILNKIKLVIGISFSFLFFVACKAFVVQKVESENISISSAASKDTSLSVLIKPYKTVLDSSMNEVLNKSLVEMSTGSPEGLLGNFVCDLSLKVGNELYNKNTGGKADFVLLNNGGLRTFLPKGEVTRRKIFEIMPFENELVVVTLTPEKIAELFYYIGVKTVKNGTRKQGVPVSGNVKVILHGKTPKDVWIDGVKIRGRNYKVITSDYLANGGDNMSFFLNPVKKEKIGIKLRDAIMNYVVKEKKKANALNAKLDKRIQYGD